MRKPVTEILPRPMTIDEFTPLVKWAAAAVGGAKVETTGKTVSVKLTAPGDVRKMLESLTGPVD